VDVNPYVFVVGCPRSGTTLLRRMLDAHPLLAMTEETHWIPRLAQPGGVVGEDRVMTSAVVTALLDYPRFATMQINGQELWTIGARSTDYSDFVTALFDLYGAKRGKKLVGDKTPGYVRAIPLLHELWPWARIVHLIRDGRDVALSALGWERKAEQFRRRFESWQQEPVATAAAWWRWHVLIGREAGGRLPPELYYELRYEQLVADPETESRRLCDFLGLPYDGAILRFHEGRTRHDPSLSPKHQWLPPTPGLRDWRTQMDPRDVERFEAVAGSLLDELGYERAVPSPPREFLEVAATVVEAFPRRPLPEGWS
jgi:hypothetical protein